MIQEFEWISVNDKLPDIINNERHLLVADCCGNVYDAFWNKRSGKFLGESLGMGLTGITHWADFPSAPKS